MFQNTCRKCLWIKKAIRAINHGLIAINIRLKHCLATESKGRLHPTDTPYFKSMHAGSQVDNALEFPPAGLDNFVLWFSRLRLPWGALLGGKDSSAAYVEANPRMSASLLLFLFLRMNIVRSL